MISSLALASILFSQQIPEYTTLEMKIEHSKEVLDHSKGQSDFMPATVWYENGIMLVYFGSNFVQIDAWHYVYDEYLNQGIED